MVTNRKGCAFLGELEDGLILEYCKNDQGGPGLPGDSSHFSGGAMADSGRCSSFAGLLVPGFLL